MRYNNCITRLSCESNKNIVNNQATKSNGRLNPPLRFIYCRYLRFNITCTSPALFPSTFLFFVVSKPQKPIVFIISCSSGDLPSKSASVTVGRSCGLLRDEVDA